MENTEQNETPKQDPKLSVGDEVKQFYKGDFKNIFITVFKNPIQGIYDLLEKPSEKAYKQSLILFASTFLLYLLGSYIIVGEGRKYMDFSNFIKISIVPVIMMFVITSLSFVIKSLSGKPNFKNELLTGGICGIPLGLLIPISLVIKTMASERDLMRLISNPMGAGVFATLLFFYLILMLINVFQQSLKSSGTKDAMAWYLSPASILLAFYVTFQIAKNMLN
jgi:hypothetical protein